MAAVVLFALLMWFLYSISSGDKRLFPLPRRRRDDW